MKQATSKSAKMVISATAAGALFILLSAGMASAEMDKGDAELVLRTAEAKKPAAFPHARHQAIVPCAECHHGKNDDGTQKPFVEGQKIGECASCHNKQDMPNAQLNSFKNAAHANCKECHKELAKAGKAAGPTKCSGCHISQ